ncbi:MAG: YmdB family metallophosphoesterase, partial [Pseudomonadota bacterium]
MLYSFSMRILFFSDIFGKPGRDALLAKVRDLTDEYGADFVVANGENAAAGAGITRKIAERLLSGGVDVIT